MKQSPLSASPRLALHPVFACGLALFALSGCLSGASGFGRGAGSSGGSGTDAELSGGLVSADAVLASSLSTLAGAAGAADGPDASAMIQSYIDQTPSGATLKLPVGRYFIHHQLKAERAILIRTYNTASQAPCAPADAGTRCAVLVASPALYDNGGMLVADGDHVTLDHLVLDGNRANRTETAAGQACKNGNNVYGKNATLHGTNGSFTNSSTINALCGTGLEAGGGPGTAMNQTITHSVFQGNGQHNSSLWSDGLTYWDGSGSTISDNQMIDNTDVDLVLGGCPNCLVQRNQILHTQHDKNAGAFTHSSFAGLMVQAWPDGGTSGNYTGADISANFIDCTGGDHAQNDPTTRRCGYGLLVGGDAWYIADVHGGTIHHNTVYGGQVGVAIDSAHDLRFYDNESAFSGGTYWTACGSKHLDTFYISPHSYNIDRTGDDVADFNYFHYTLAGCIPNSADHEY